MPHHRQFLAAVLLAAATSAGCSGNAPAPNAATPRERTRDRVELSSLSHSTVTLLVLSEGLWGETTRSREGAGSGFVVDSAGVPVVVTAAHVVRGATEIVVVDAEGRRAQATELLTFEEAGDVAVLRVPGLSPSIRPIPVGRLPEVGEEIMLVSSPLGLSTTVAFGTVAAHRPEMHAVQLAAGVSPGSSGGLVADRRGRAVAVIRSKAPAELGGENIAIATPIALVERSLSEAESLPLSPRPDRKRMQMHSQHRLLSTRADEPEAVYAGQTRVVVSVGDRPVEHVCARTGDEEAAVAIREVEASDPLAWRDGLGNTCATIAGGGEIEVWVGTKRAGQPVELTIRRQK